MDKRFPEIIDKYYDDALNAQYKREDLNGYITSKMPKEPRLSKGCLNLETHFIKTIWTMPLQTCSVYLKD